MSDRSLCIACQENYVEIRDAITGRFLRRIDSSPNCNMAISPNGEILALAMDSGELQLFNSGPDWDFNTEPVWVVKKTDASGKLRYVKCMAFSPNSNYLSTCTFDNIIRTYKLNMTTNTSTLISTHTTAGITGDGITGLSLYNPALWYD